MGTKFMKRLASRGATLPEYAIILAIMALAAIGIRGALWETGREESAQQEACISQIPPPSLAADGSGCEIPVMSTTSTIPPPTTTPTTSPPTTLAPSRPTAPQSLVTRPTYDATGRHYLDVVFSPPVNSTTVPVVNYQYSTDGGVTWKNRATGTTQSPLRIDIESDTFNAPLAGATDYDVAIRAVTANGVEGKRSAVWRVSTARALLRCADGTYCPENFSTYLRSPGNVLVGRHKLSASSSTLVGFAEFEKTTSVNLFVVAAGGGGGGNGGGGGGGGGVIRASGATATADDSPYWVIAGAGGAAGTSSTRGGQGDLSLFGGYVTYGGGGGAARDGASATPPCDSAAKSCPTITFSSRGGWDSTAGAWPSLVTPYIGSGGGGANTITGYRRAGGNGKTGEGRSGGWGCTSNGFDCSGLGTGGGGGGHNAPGTDGLLGGPGGTGGDGTADNIDDGATNLRYGAGGGGGKTNLGNPGLGGNCTSAGVDGCVGGSTVTGRRVNGQDGRGGGGAGGSGGTGAANPGRGGGGVVIFTYTLTYLQISPEES